MDNSTSTSNYALLPPSAFNFERGYTYATMSTGSDGEIIATPIPSGFYAGAQLKPIILEDGVIARKVSEDEANDGIGTYLGAMLVVSDTTISKTDPTWQYASVISHDYNRNSLRLISSDGVREYSIQWNNGDEIEVVNEAIYAMAPYSAMKYSEVSCDDMAEEHNRLNELMDVGQVGKKGRRKIDQLKGSSTHRKGDDQIVVVNVETLELTNVTVQHAIDWYYYGLSGRVAPANLKSLERDPSLTTEDKGSRRRGLFGNKGAAIRASPRQLKLPQSNIPSVGNSAPYTPLDIVRNLEQSNDDFQNGCTNARNEGLDKQEVIRRLQQELVEERNLRGPDNASNERHYDMDKASFRPSDQQHRVHLRITKNSSTGKSKKALAHAYCEDLLTEEFYNIMPHPQIVVCLYECRFGPGALSILHGRKVSEFDMLDSWDNKELSSSRDFSNKGKCPKACPIKSHEDGYTTLMLCIHNWNSITEKLWQPDITKIFRLIEQVLERFNNIMTTEMVFPTDRFINWIDARLYRVRRALASTETHRLIDAMMEISVTHFSFDGVKMAAQKLSSTRAPKPSPVNNQKAGTPSEIAAMIPVNEHGKQACMKYWSKYGCKGKGKICENETRAHFKPPKSKVNEKLIDYIKEKYGGIRNDAFSEE